MQKRIKLSIEMLKSFSTKELRGFAVFVESRYFNPDKDLEILLKKLVYYCCKNKRDFSEEVELKVYNSVYSVKLKKISKEQRDALNKKLNKLLRLSELFLMNETLKEKEHLKNELLIPELIKRRQNLLFERILTKESKELDTIKQKGIDYHKRQHRLQEGIQKYNYIENLDKDNYSKLDYHLDICFLIEKLSHHLTKLVLSKWYPDRKFDFSQFMAVESFVNLPQYKKHPIIKIYLLSIQLVKNEKFKTYKFLFDELKQHIEVIPGEFLKPFYTILSNYCNKQIRKGSLKYNKHALDIYKHMHEHNLLLKDNAIRVGLIKNIVTLSCYAQDFIFANEILKTYIKYIKLSLKNCILCFNKAIISFHQCHFNQTLKYLNQVVKIDKMHNLIRKIYLLKCFYEIDKNYEREIEQEPENLRIYLVRTEGFSSYIKDSIKNFIAIYKTLYNLKCKLNTHSKKEILQDLIQIKEKMNSFDFIGEKYWIEEKIGEIENLGN